MRRIIFAASVFIGLAVGIYGWYISHAVVSSVFLGLAGFVLLTVVNLLLDSAQALVTEPPAVEASQVTGRRKKELEREKASLLKALKELEFDHEMGKVSDGDFREIGGQYRARAMRVLRQLDEQGADYKSLVEKELKARLHAKSDSAKGEAAAPAVEAGDAVVIAPAPKANSCASCGTANDPDAVFCKKCGKKVAA